MSAISAYKKHGVTKNNLHNLCLNFFHFPPQFRDCLDKYFIYHWNGKKFEERMQDGIIPISSHAINDSYDDAYIVVYQDCNAWQVKRAKEIKLSFRKPLAEFDIPAYVIVRIVTE